jgi:hypothetical protein
LVINISNVLMILAVIEALVIGQSVVVHVLYRLNSLVYYFANYAYI